MTQAIIQRLLATSAVTDIVGQKIYLIVAPATVKKPYLTVRQASNPPDDLKGTPTIDYPQFEVWAYGETGASVYAVSAVVRAACEAITGTVEGTNFSKVWQIDAEDLFDQDDQAVLRRNIFRCIVKR